jgi:uncharacterized membrane protein
MLIAVDIAAMLVLLISACFVLVLVGKALEWMADKHPRCLDVLILVVIVASFVWVIERNVRGTFVGSQPTTQPIAVEASK